MPQACQLRRLVQVRSEGVRVYTSPRGSAATSIEPLYLTRRDVDDPRPRALPASPAWLVQADLFDLPFRPGQFATVTCHGLLHLFGDAGAVLGALRTQVAVGGSLYVTSLVAETFIGRLALRQMHRGGQAAVPRQAGDLATVVRTAIGGPVHAWCEGSMMFICAGPLTTPRYGEADGG